MVDRDTTGFRWLVRIGSLTLAASFGLSAAAVMAQEQDTVRPAAIHTGTCDSPGEAVFALDPLVVLPAPDDDDDDDDDGPSGPAEFVGAQGAAVVEGADDSEISTTLDTLVGAPHLIAVFESEGSATIIACGEIGGFRFPNEEDMAIGLREQGGSGFAGVALLEDEDDDTEVEVEIYLARDVVGGGG